MNTLWGIVIGSIISGVTAWSITIFRTRAGHRDAVLQIITKETIESCLEFRRSVLSLLESQALLMSWIEDNKPNLPCNRKALGIIPISKKFIEAGQAFRSAISDLTYFIQGEEIWSIEGMLTKSRSIEMMNYASWKDWQNDIIGLYRNGIQFTDDLLIDRTPVGMDWPNEYHNYSKLLA